MNFKFNHIAHRLTAQIIILAIYLSTIAYIIFLRNSKLKESQNMETCLNGINNDFSGSYIQAGNFLLTVNSSKQFFMSGTHKSITDFNTSIKTLTDNVIWNNSSHSSLQQRGNTAFIDSLNTSIENYRFSFNNLTLAIKALGSSYSGALLELQTYSDKIIKSLKFSTNSTTFEPAFKLKKLEAQLFAEPYPSLFPEINNLLDELIFLTPSLTDAAVDDPDAGMDLANMPSSGSGNPGGLINSYKTSLELLKSLSDKKKGEFELFIASYDKLKTNLSVYSTQLTSQDRRFNLKWNLTSLFFVLLSTGLYIYILWRFMLTLKIPLENAVEFTKSLSKGKLQDISLNNKAAYEFSLLNDSLNRLNNSIKEKKSFVEKLLKQKVDVELELQGKNDSFGKTLLALKENIKKSREEQLKYEEENKLRRYLNEGIAHFADILRTNSGDFKKLADIFIQEIVKYLNAIQGGLFIYENEERTDLQLVAAFAFNRKKYLARSIPNGEGLVGTCAIEKKSIHLTELPEDYLELTSGLGDAPPRNVLLLPVIYEGELSGVIEIASMHKFETHQIEAGEKIASSLASTFILSKNNERTSILLEKSQQQAAEMREQEEEMRQNMEELKATQEESARREEELEGMLKALNQSFYLIEYNLEGNIIKANEKIFELFDLPDNAIINKTHSQIFGEKSKVDVLLFANVIDGKTVSHTEDVIIRGKLVEIESTFSPIQSKDGKTTRILNILRVNFKK